MVEKKFFADYVEVHGESSELYFEAPIPRWSDEPPDSLTVVLSWEAWEALIEQLSEELKREIPKSNKKG